MKYKFQNNKKGNNGSLSKRLSLIWILVLIFLTLHVFFAVQFSSMGAQIALYEEEVWEMERENENLSMSLIDLKSLTKLSAISEDMGFGKIGSTIYLHPGDSFAKAQ